MTRFLPLPLIAAALSGCLYADIHRPRAWRTATPAEVKASPADETVSGKSCSHVVLYLVGWGDAGYAAAARNALAGKDGVLYDVRADIHGTSYVLGLYARACTVVTGKVGKL